MSSGEDKKAVTFPIVRVAQPIGEFYIGKIESRALYSISWVDIRRIFKEREFESYLGIQRPLNKKRVKEIKNYVTTMDATFPTAVILAVDEKCAQVDFLEGDIGFMTLSNITETEAEGPDEIVLFGNIAKIIDGQHRIEGLRDYTGPEFDINVSVFVGMDLPDQAMVFSTVNLAQTKVNRSLVYDLFELMDREVQKSCHDIVVALDGTEGSPFFHRIKRLGTATEGRFGETLSQSTVVKALLKYISRNPAQDRDNLKRGRSIDKADAREARKLIFRNMFVEKRDLDIADIVWNFFGAVNRRWPKAWKASGRGYILNRTNGFNGLMRFLRPAYLNFTTTEEVVSEDDFFSIFEDIDIDDMYFTTDNFKPGSSGATALYHLLMTNSSLEEM